MVKTKIKRAVSFVMATVLSLSAFMSIGTSTTFAASGEKTKVYMVDFPRDGDANYDGVWGHSNLTLKNGWHTGSSTHTNLKAIGSYYGNIAYCIEPGVSLSSGQSMNKYDENYFNNITANGVISGDEIRLFIGRILQYGYRGTISTSWRSQNESAARSDWMILEESREVIPMMETMINQIEEQQNLIAEMVQELQERDRQLLSFQEQNKSLKSLNSELSGLLNLLPDTEELLSQIEQQKTRIVQLETENQQWQELTQKLNSENSLLQKQNSELLTLNSR